MTHFLISLPQPNSGRCPLHVAAATGCTSVCEFLISKYPSLADQADAAGRLPLHYAIMSYSPERGMEPCDITDLISIFATVGSSQFVTKTRSGATALHFAALIGIPSVISLVYSHMMEADIPKSIRDKLGRTPLHYFALLQQEGVEINAFDELLKAKALFCDLLSCDRKVASSIFSPFTY
jgi:ankyrin repeat protein